MPILAFAAVLLAALTHATWNYFAKRAAGSRHFVLAVFGGLASCSTRPIVVWILHLPSPALHAHALGSRSLATGVLHMAYSLLLQAGYRVSDLSLVYPIARGTGPLLSFIAATVFLHEPANSLSVLGVLLIVSGILLVSGLTELAAQGAACRRRVRAADRCVHRGYTINDGWAVKVLLISPFIIDFSGNLFRAVVLTPLALRDRAGAGARSARVPGCPCCRQRARAAWLHPRAVRDAGGSDRPRGAGARVGHARGQLLRREAAEGAHDAAARDRRGAHRARVSIGLAVTRPALKASSQRGVAAFAR